MKRPAVAGRFARGLRTRRRRLFGGADDDEEDKQHQHQGEVVEIEDAAHAVPPFQQFQSILPTEPKGRNGDGPFSDHWGMRLAPSSPQANRV